MKQVLLLCLFPFSVLFAQDDTVAIDQARRFLYAQDSVYRPHPFSFATGKPRILTVEQSLAYYTFIREIKSPLTDARFFTFCLSYMSPSPTFVVASYDHTFHILVQPRTEGYPPEAVLDFLNSRLSRTTPLNFQELFDLTRTITELSSQTFAQYHILSSFDQMEITPKHPSPNRLPDSLRSLVRPLSIRSTYDHLQVEYYVWNGMMLSKVILDYSDNALALKIIWTWDSGRRFLYL